MAERIEKAEFARRLAIHMITRPLPLS